MSTIKGHTGNNSAITKDVTVTESTEKTSLDVNISGGNTSPGTGSGIELEGANVLASGSLLYGLDYKRVIKQASPDSITDIFNVYSDSDGTNLISILTIIYSTAAKKITEDVKREDQ